MAATLTNSGEQTVSYISFPIEKTETTEDGDLIVYGKATDGSVDSDEQIVDPDWSAKALQQWLDSYKNVRFQHQSARPIGKGLEIEITPDGHYVKSLIVESEAKNLVRKGVLQAYSVGIARPTIVRDPLARGGRIKGGEFVEISLVDRPANKNCGIQLIKAAKDGNPEWVGKVWGGSDILTKSEGTDTVVNLNLPSDVSVSFSPADLARVLAKRNGTATVEKRDFDRNVGGGVDRDKLKESDFAGRNRSFPIVTPGDVSDALHSIGRAGADNYDAATLRKNILRIARRKGFPVPDSADKPKKKNKSLEAELADLEARLEALKSKKDPDNDGDDDSTAEGDTDHDFWTEDGKQKKPLPGKKKKNKGDGGPQLHFDDHDDDDVDGDADEDEDGESESETPATPDSVQGKSTIPPEILTAMRLKSARVPMHLGMLHDFCCPAFSPDDVQKCYPGHGFYALDTVFWQQEALGKAGDGSLTEAKLMAQLWQYAEMLKSSRPSDTLRLRYELHKSFQDANPGPGHSPVPSGQIHPRSYNRPFITADHQAASPGQEGPNTAKVPADSISASQFGRAPLSADHAANSPSYSTRGNGIQPPSSPGHLQSQSFGSVPESNLMQAMNAMHDHIAQTFPDVCPLKPANATDLHTNPVPTPGSTPSARAAKDAEPDTEKCDLPEVHDGPSSAAKPSGQINPDSYNRGYLSSGHAAEHASGGSSGLEGGLKPAKVNGPESDVPIGKAISRAVEKTISAHLDKVKPPKNKGKGAAKKDVEKAIEKALNTHLAKITPPPASAAAENAAVNVEKAIADYLEKASVASTPTAITKMAEVDVERAVIDYLDKASVRTATQKAEIRDQVSDMLKDYVKASASPQTEQQQQPITQKGLKKAVTAALKKAAVNTAPPREDTAPEPVQPEPVDIKATVADAIKEAMSAVAPQPQQTMDLETFAELIRPQTPPQPTFDMETFADLVRQPAQPSLDKDALVEVTRPLMERLAAQERALLKQQKALRKQQAKQVFDAMPPVAAPVVEPVPAQPQGLTQEDLAEFMRPLYDKISAQDQFMRKQEKRLQKQQRDLLTKQMAAVTEQAPGSDNFVSRELIADLAEKLQSQGVADEQVGEIIAPLIARMSTQSDVSKNAIKEVTEPLTARLEAQERLIRKQQKQIRKQQKKQESETLRQQLLQGMPQPAPRGISKSASLSEFSVPLLERMESQEKLLRKTQKELKKAQDKLNAVPDIAKTVDAMAGMPDPAISAFRGFGGTTPFRQQASAGSVPQNVAEVAGRTQAMMLEELEQQFRTSPDPLQREAAWKMMMKMRGLSSSEQ